MTFKLFDVLKDWATSNEFVRTVIFFFCKILMKEELLIIIIGRIMDINILFVIQMVR